MTPLRAPIRPTTLAHADRHFPTDLSTRMIARKLHEVVRALPVISPLAAIDVRWLSDNEPLPDPARLFVVEDREVLRTLYSHGVALDELGVARRDGLRVETDAQEIWRRFAENYHLFRATPTRLWHDHVFSNLFGLNERLSLKTADVYFARIAACLTKPEFRPRALFESMQIEAVAVPASPVDELRHYTIVRGSGLRGRILPIYAPDSVVDPEHDGFFGHLDRLGDVTSLDTRTWRGYLDAHRQRRAFFKAAGATTADHTAPSARTIDLPPDDAERLFQTILSREFMPEHAELFRATMLIEMARMSLEDGLVMQIRPGLRRQADPIVSARFGIDWSPGVACAIDYGRGLKPLLDRFGHEPKFTLVVAGQDPAGGARELAPLTGRYPALRIAPACTGCSPDDLRRFRELTAPAAGLYKSAGAPEDAHLLSIPARHDIARRVDCSYLAQLVASHQLDEDDALDLAKELAYGLTKRTYKL